jgi:DNA-binding beta-propeller fold protein YncE
VFVTNQQDTTLSVIDVKHCNDTDTDRCDGPTDKLAVDDYPSSTAIDPTVGTAFVTSNVKGTLGVVQTR